MKNVGTIHRLEVAQIIFTFSCGGLQKKFVQKKIHQFEEEVCKSFLELKIYNMEKSSFQRPKIHWHETNGDFAGGWYGGFQIIIASQETEPTSGKSMDLEEYQDLTILLHKAIQGIQNKKDYETSDRFWLEQPFLWTLALSLEPSVDKWNGENISRHKRSLLALTTPYSSQWKWKNNSATEAILGNNLSTSNREVQFIDEQSGFLICDQAVLHQNRMTTLHQSIIERNEHARGVASYVRQLLQKNLSLQKQVTTNVRKQYGNNKTIGLLQQQMVYLQTAALCLEDFATSAVVQYQEKKLQDYLTHKYNLDTTLSFCQNKIQQLSQLIQENYSKQTSQRLFWFQLLIVFPVAVTIANFYMRIQVFSKKESWSALKTYSLTTGLSFAAIFLILWFLHKRK